jgi:hypothetical protein
MHNLFLKKEWKIVFLHGINRAHKGIPCRASEEIKAIIPVSQNGDS